MGIQVDVLLDILKDAVTAPSGDNSQPWYFEWKEDTLTVFMVEGKDNAFLNHKNFGTLLAHGALIENINILASQRGLETDVTLFPGESSNATARISFRTSVTGKDELSEKVTGRHTNRRAYDCTSVTKELSSILSQQIKNVPGVQLEVRSGDDMKKLAWAGSRAEIAILENRELHHLLFNNVVWTEKEEREKKEGLFIDTLELAPPQKFIFTRCRKWGFMSFLNRFKFAHFIANEDAKIYKTGSAYVALITPHSTPTDFIQVGRAMERLWIALNASGYAVHPISATLFFGQKIKADRANGLTPHHWGLMKEAFATIENVFDAKDKNIAFMFRVGSAPRVSARSSKKAPQITVI